MVLLTSYTIDAGTARDAGSSPTGQHSFVAPVPVSVSFSEILVKKDAIKVPYVARDVTRELYCSGNDVRLVEFDCDGSVAGIANTLEFYDAAETQESLAASFNPSIEEKLLLAGSVILRVKHPTTSKSPWRGRIGSYNFGKVGVEDVDLTKPNRRFYHRNSALRKTFFDAHVLDSGLEMLVVTDYRANEDQVDFAVSIHNAGINEELADDIEFNWIRIRTSDQVEVDMPEWEGCHDIDNNYLVKKATSSEGTHFMPQRGLRTVYFSLKVKSNAAGVTPDTIRPFAGQMGCAAAFHAYEAGICGTPLPLFGNLGTLGSHLDSWYNEHKASFLAPNQLPSYGGHDPVSSFWPSILNWGADQTGGLALQWNVGAMQTAVPTATRWEVMRIEMTRWVSRQITSIFDNGYPITAARYLNNGVAPWRHFAGQWLLGNWAPGGKPIEDSPFDYSQVTTRRTHSESPYRNNNYETGGNFRAIDEAHWPRAYKEQVGLAWYTNDPVAWMHVRMNAQLCMMTYAPWDGGGHDIFEAPKGLPGKGMNVGRGPAWSGVLIAHANAQYTPWPADPYYNVWLDRMIDKCQHAQLPSGLLSAQNTGREAVIWPFGSAQPEGPANYYVYRSTQQNKLGHCLWASRQLRPSATNRQAEIDVVMGSLIWGMANFCNNQSNSTGVEDKYVAGPNDGSGYRYATRAQIPLLTPQGEDLIAALDSNDAYQYSGFVGYAIKLGHADWLNMIRKLTSNYPSGSAAACETTMEGWNQQGVSHAAIWAATLGYLQLENAS